MHRGQSPNSFNMSGITGALPDIPGSAPIPYSLHDQSRFATDTSSSASAFHLQSSPLPASNLPVHQAQFASPHNQGYGQVPQNTHVHPAGLSPSHSSFAGNVYYPQQHPQYLYYTGQYGHPILSQQNAFPSSYSQASMPGYSQQGAEFSAMVGRTAHTSFSPGAPPNHAFGNSGQLLRPGIMPSRFQLEIEE